jgi:hypothetical protein
MNMLNDNLEYTINTQSQIYLEIKACQNNKNKIRIFNICHKNLSSYIMKLNLEDNMKHIIQSISRSNFKQNQV